MELSARSPSDIGIFQQGNINIMNLNRRNRSSPTTESPKHQTYDTNGHHAAKGLSKPRPPCRPEANHSYTILYHQVGYCVGLFDPPGICRYQTRDGFRVV